MVSKGEFDSNISHIRLACSFIACCIISKIEIPTNSPLLNMYNILKSFDFNGDKYFSRTLQPRLNNASDMLFILMLAEEKRQYNETILTWRHELTDVIKLTDLPQLALEFSKYNIDSVLPKYYTSLFTSSIHKFKWSDAQLSQNKLIMSLEVVNNNLYVNVKVPVNSSGELSDAIHPISINKSKIDQIIKKGNDEENVREIIVYKEYKLVITNKFEEIEKSKIISYSYMINVDNAIKLIRQCEKIDGESTQSRQRASRQAPFSFRKISETLTNDLYKILQETTVLPITIEKLKQLITNDSDADKNYSCEELKQFFEPLKKFNENIQQIEMDGKSIDFGDFKLINSLGNEFKHVLEQNMDVLPFSTKFNIESLTKDEDSSPVLLWLYDKYNIYNTNCKKNSKGSKMSSDSESSQSNNGDESSLTGYESSQSSGDESLSSNSNTCTPIQNSGGGQCFFISVLQGEYGTKRVNKYGQYLETGGGSGSRWSFDKLEELRTAYLETITYHQKLAYITGIIATEGQRIQAFNAFLKKYDANLTIEDLQKDEISEPMNIYGQKQFKSSLLTDVFTAYLASEFYWMDEGFIKHFLDNFKTANIIIIDNKFNLMMFEGGYNINKKLPFILILFTGDNHYQLLMCNNESKLSYSELSGNIKYLVDNIPSSFMDEFVDAAEKPTTFNIGNHINYQGHTCTIIGFDKTNNLIGLEYNGEKFWVDYDALARGLKSTKKTKKRRLLLRNYKNKCNKYTLKKNKVKCNKLAKNKRYKNKTNKHRKDKTNKNIYISNLNKTHKQRRRRAFTIKKQ
jgi:hypothetical protein